MCFFCLNSTVYNMAFYSASKYLPVATLGGIETCMVILASAGMTAVVDRTLSFRAIGAAILCLAGSVLLVQPPFLFRYFGTRSRIVTHPICLLGDNDVIPGDNNVTSHNLTLYSSELCNRSKGDISDDVTAVISDEVTGYALLIVSSLSAAVQLGLLKFPLKGSNAFMLSFWKGLVGSLASAAILGALETPTFPSGTPCIGLLFGHCVAVTWSTILCTFSMLMISPIMSGILRSGQPFFFLVP